MITPPEGTVGYRQLAEILRGRIESGEWSPGDRLPSENDLIQTYGVARETARRAVRELRDEGLVVVRHGYPTRVRGRVERTPVKVARGSTLVVRRATPAEVGQLQIGPGALVVEVSLGGRSVVYPADRHFFTFS